MFKKKPQIKNLSPLRSSDRRKLANQIIADFRVEVPVAASPAPSSAPPSDEKGEAHEPTQPTLSSIRSSLLPENCSSARFTTHAGADNTLVSGIVYVGAHPGQEERILWLQWGAREPRLYPTVYTLWQNPGLVPLLHTPGVVVQKLRTGADLMTPGLIGGPPWPERAKKNAIVAVASMERPSVPVWVGSCEIDVSALGRVQGAKGKAVDGVHWTGDEIWAWSQTGAVVGGREAPEMLQGWGDELADDRLHEGVEGLELDDENEDPAEDGGGVALGETEKGGEDEEANHEPTVSEVDQAFHQAFVYAIFNAKKNGNPPHYGLDLPIQPSFLVANMIQPHLQFQNQHYTIKKTSWKNAKRFIKYLDKQHLIKSKDRNGGETVILDIDFDDQQIKAFVPYKLPKPKAEEKGGGSDPANSNGTTDPALSQTLTLQHLFKASSKLTPDLVPSKTDFYTSAQISKYIRTYIDNSPELTASASSKRFVKINPFIANNILSSDQSLSDTRILAAGEIGRDVLQKRVLEDHNLCIPYWVLLKDAQKWDPENPDRSLPKPKSGAPPTVNITIEKRTGTKTVTKITGLETFNISPQIMAPELQKKCASSTSVAQAVGGKPGMMEVLVQGDQREIVTKEVGRRGIKKEWVDVVDKTKKKGPQVGGGGGGGGGGRR